MRKRAGELSFLSRLTSTLVLALSVLLFLLLVAIITLHNDRRAVEQKELDTLALRTSWKIERVLSYFTEKVDAIAFAIEQQNGDTIAFDVVSHSLIANDAVLNIFIAPGCVISKMQPLTGNEDAVGRDCTMPGDSATFRAIRLGIVSMSGPARNADGENVLSVRMPVYLEGELWGLVGMDADFDALFDPVLFDDPMTDGFTYRVWPDKTVGAGHTLLWKSDGEATPQVGTARITGYGLRWYVEASRKYNHADTVRNWLYFTVLILMCLLIIALYSHYLNLHGIKKSMENQALTDNMTGLPNRRHIIATLTTMVEDAELSGEPFVVLYMDLNNFKDVNDIHGHETGDEVLRKTASILRDNAKELGFIGRIGGDEFVILLEKMKPGKMLDRIIDVLAHKLRMNVKRPGSSPGHAVEVSASFGVSSFPRDGADSTSLLRAADLAMYQTKKRLKGTTIIGPFKSNFRQ
jgi:diguanylate cyclase (GGDEF) domain